MSSLMFERKPIIDNGRANCGTTDVVGEFKHPLHNTWTMWYFKVEKAREWSENQRRVASFGTAEDFWALYNYIQPASRLNQGCDYSLFKEGIQPMWEDPVNKGGGRWVLNVDRRHRMNELNQLWLETVLCLIGEAFDDETEEICGAVINVRMKGDKIAVWTRDATNVNSNMKIGHVLKSRLGLHPDSVVLEYQAHNDTMVKAGSAMKALYCI